MMGYIKGFWDYRFLLHELVIRGIRLKYRRSYLGIVWSLIEPIMTTIVLVIVFGTLFGNKQPDFPLYIVVGRLLYNFFQEGTKGACKSIRANAGMIKKVYVPKYFYPLSSVLFNFVIFLISLLAIIPIAIYTGTLPSRRIWHFIPAVIYLLILVVGVGMILSTLNVFFRDIEYLWNVSLLMIMYISAIFYYPEKLLKSGWFWILKYNPVFCIIDLARSGILNYYATWWNFLYPLAFGLVTVVIGFVFFKKNQDRFILYI